MTLPCTRFTRNNPGCRCPRCISTRRTLKAEKRHADATEKVRRSEARKRAAPWEGLQP